jgi:hypothetical protein
MHVFIFSFFYTQRYLFFQIDRIHQCNTNLKLLKKKENYEQTHNNHANGIK